MAEEYGPTTDPARSAVSGKADDPEPKQAKRNLTDGDSRLMPTRNGWVQGYIVQAVPMMQATQAAADAIAAHTGADTTIGDTLMDTGYDSEETQPLPADRG